MRRAVHLTPVLVAALVIVTAACSDGTSPASSTSSRSSPASQRVGSELVAEFSGSGDQETAEFTVQEGWEIRWETSGESFRFAITGDKDFGTVVDQQGEGGGVTNPAGQGAFRLFITAVGPWTVSIFNRV